MKNLLAFLALLASPVNAHELDRQKETFIGFQWGFEPLVESNYSWTASKLAGFSVEGSFRENLLGKVQLGYFNDRRSGARDMWWFGPALGMQVSPWIFDIKAYLGVAGITKTDSYLGGHFQFTQEVYFGIRDDFGSVGIGFLHMSCGGFYACLPNKGRNAATLTVKLKVR